MSDLIEKDSDGVEHIMWLQERDMSCGPACVYMIKSNRAQMSMLGGEDAVREVSSSLPNGYGEKSGTNASALSTHLTMWGIPSKTSHVDMAMYTVQNRPMFIAHIAWSDGSGHFIVVSRKTSKGDLVCLDPWYGLCETPLVRLPSYMVNQDARKHVSYAAPIQGFFSGWIATT